MFMSGERKKIESFKDLEVWKKGVRFSIDVYKITSGFPSNEQYGLTNQLRRAATSFPELVSIVSIIFSVISFGSLIALGERRSIILSNLAFSSLRSMFPAAGLGEKDLESLPLPSFLAKQLLHSTGLPFLGSKGTWQFTPHSSQIALNIGLS